jgi:hypothetical protein
VEFGDIDAGAEGLPSAPDDDDADRFVRLKFQKGPAQLQGEVCVEGVVLLGPIQGDPADPVPAFHHDEVVRQGEPPLVKGCFINPQ